MKKLLLLFLSFTLALSHYSCKNTGDKSGQQTENNQNTIIQKEIKPFLLPDMPITYTEPEQQVDFLSTHYWDNFDFSDTVYIHHPEITEKAWAEYIGILKHVPAQKAYESITRFMEKAENNNKTYLYFTNLADKYLYDPNSPFLNEELYIPVLESMTQSNYLSESEKIRPKERLEMANKNRIGKKACDITYTLDSGKKGNLHTLSAEYILLYFHNPGCHACEEISTAMQNSLRIQHQLHEKRMIILTVYPDEDLSEWKKHLHEFPTEWINGYDKELSIEKGKLYDLKAIPTLYLLDRNKVVLLKDTTVPAIEDYLYRN